MKTWIDKRGVLSYIFAGILLTAYFLGLYYRYKKVVTIDSQLLKKINQNVILQGKIISEVDSQYGNNQFDFKIEKYVLNKEVVVLSPSNAKVSVKCFKCTIGSVVQINGLLTYPKNTEEFNRQNYLLGKNIQLEIQKGSAVMVQKPPWYYLQIAKLFYFKLTLINNLKKYLNQEEAALGSGILISGKGEFDKKLLEDFRRAGLIHLVVLSGFNVTIVAQVIMAVFSFLPKLLGAILGSFGVILFAIMVGGGATVVRSVIMALIGVFSKVYDKEYLALYALLSAGALMALYNPLIVIYDPSFQLSFMGTLGLILNGNYFNYVFRKIPEWFGLREILASTVATQFFVSPLILRMSGDISVFSLLSNILVVPIMPLAMLIVFLLCVAGFVGGQMYFITFIPAELSKYILEYILRVAKGVSGLNFAIYHIENFGLNQLVIWYAILIPISVFLYRKFN